MNSVAAKELRELVRIARAATDIVMDVYGAPFEVEMKGPATLSPSPTSARTR
jgi:hypothetical protein